MIPCIDPATVGFDVALPDYLRAAAGAGFRAVEFSIVRAREFAAGRSAAELAGLAGGLGVELAQFTCGTGVPSNITVSEAGFRRGLARWREGCELAASLGCRRASVLVNSVKGDGFEEDGVRLTAGEVTERLAALAAGASEHGVHVSVEFVDREHLERAGEILTGAGAANLGLLLDTFNLYDQRDPLTYLSRLPAGIISWIQLADAQTLADGRQSASGPSVRRTLPGMGRLDLSAILRACRRNGYDGHASVEVYGFEPLDALALPEKTRWAASSVLGGDLSPFFG